MFNLKLAIKYIKFYKKRSISILIGMVLSVALISSIIILSRSANQATIQAIKYNDGSYHVLFKNLNINQVNAIKNNKSVKNKGFAKYYDSVELAKNFYLYISRADKEYFKLCSSFENDSFIKEGRFPQNDDEIAAEEWILNILGIDPKINSNIKLKLKDRDMEKDFKLVGILKDRSEQKRTITMQVFLPIENELSGNNNVAMLTFKNEKNIQKSISLLSKNINIKNKKDDILKNSELVESYEKLNSIDKSVILPLIVILAVSFVVIYGIYNISIIQRVSEYGILLAIGSNKKKLMKTILFELIILGIVSIPIGILLGIVGSKLLSGLVENVFTEGLVNIQNLVITKEAIIIPILIILIDIGLTGMVVYLTISKISPVDAMRKNLGSKKEYKGKIHEKFLLKNKLSIYSKLAIKNTIYNSRSFLMIVLSISIGGILFVNSSYTRSMEQINMDRVIDILGYNSDYKINLVPGTQKTEGLDNKDLNKIKSLKGVKNLSAIQIVYARLMLSKDKIAQPAYFENKNNSPYIKHIMNGMLVENKKAKNKSEELILKNNLYGYDDKSLKDLNKYLVRGKVDVDKMKKENVAIIRIPNPLTNVNTSPYVAKFKVGDKIRVAFSNIGTNSEDNWTVNYNDSSYKYKEYTVGAIVNNLLDYDNYYTVKNSVDVVLSSDIFTRDTGITKYKIISIHKKDGVNHNVLNNKIQSIIEKNPGTILRDLNTEIEKYNQARDDKYKFINTIIIILFIVGLFNIANNIKYSIISRRKEIGMLRAVGITNKNVKKMFLSEGLIYGLASSIIVFIFGVLVQYNIYRKYFNMGIIETFKIQYKDYLLIVALNFIVIIITIYISSRNIRKLSVVDMIENEE